jgi:hypothetical protein
MVSLWCNRTEKSAYARPATMRDSVATAVDVVGAWSRLLRAAVVVGKRYS